MTMARSMWSSGLLDGDLLEDVRDLLEPVDGGLERVDDVLELQDLERLVATVEELGEEPAIRLVAQVLQAVDLDPVLLEVLGGPELHHGLLGELRAALDHLDLLRKLLGKLLDLVEEDEIDRLVHVV